MTTVQELKSALEWADARWGRLGPSDPLTLSAYLTVASYARRLVKELEETP